MPTHTAQTAKRQRRWILRIRDQERRLRNRHRDDKPITQRHIKRIDTRQPRVKRRRVRQVRRPRSNQIGLCSPKRAIIVVHRKLVHQQYMFSIRAVIASHCHRIIRIQIIFIRHLRRKSDVQLHKLEFLQRSASRLVVQPLRILNELLQPFILDALCQRGRNLMRHIAVHCAPQHIAKDVRELFRSLVDTEISARHESRLTHELLIIELIKYDIRIQEKLDGFRRRVGEQCRQALKICVSARVIFERELLQFALFDAINRFHHRIKWKEQRLTKNAGNICHGRRVGGILVRVRVHTGRIVRIHVNHVANQSTDVVTHLVCFRFVQTEFHEHLSHGVDGGIFSHNVRVHEVRVLSKQWKFSACS
mmetsp:Transcript_25120/g.40781  ORF Transcript_25120/g.40781 Transcript_25120/m.40781 type:complete len:363 (+) Transcript_25120:492-1580(+)